MLTEKSAISNGPFSLLSLTAARRLNSATGENGSGRRSLNHFFNGLLLEGSGRRGWDDESLFFVYLILRTTSVLGKP